MWRRWRRGEGQWAIAHALRVPPMTVRHRISLRGGIAPPERRRSRLSLSPGEREEISRGLAAGRSCRQIAAALRRLPPTVSCEVARDFGPARYRAAEADRRAWRRSLRPKPCRLASNGRVRQAIAHKLRASWSPEQIAGWLRMEYPDEPSMQVSHETIYRSLFIQARGVLKKELLRHLRTRRAKKFSRKGGSQGRIPDAISIRKRPAEAADRAIPGHWEGDLVAGSHNSWIATLVERKSRSVMPVKVEGSHTETVVLALIKQGRKLPATLRRSLTWDRGSEMAMHKDFTVLTDVQVYFCDPGSPWQRGTNENTNGLLRQYFPKGTDLRDVTQAELNRVALQLNQRPRKTLGFKAPAEMLSAMMR